MNEEKFMVRRKTGKDLYSNTSEKIQPVVSSENQNIILFAGKVKKLTPIEKNKWYHNSTNLKD